MNPKLQQLREAIIKEIPEIVELKMGCFVEVEWNDGRKETLPYRNKTTLIKRDDIFKTDGCGCCSINFSEEKVKIIGRKITLADVLRVLKKNEKAALFDIMRTLAGDEFPEVYWDLENNDLNLQSKETIDFLSKIICKKDERH